MWCNSCSKHSGFPISVFKYKHPESFSIFIVNSSATPINKYYKYGFA